MKWMRLNHLSRDNSLVRYINAIADFCCSCSSAQSNVSAHWFYVSLSSRSNFLEIHLKAKVGFPSTHALNVHNFSTIFVKEESGQYFRIRFESLRPWVLFENVVILLAYVLNIYITIL